MKMFGPTQKAIEIPRLTQIDGKWVGVGGDYITASGEAYPEATQAQYRKLAKKGFPYVQEFNEEEE